MSNSSKVAEVAVAARNGVPEPPKHLKRATKRWFRAVVHEYDALEEHHVRLLVLAAESWERAQEAREVLARDGAYYVDKVGQPRAHPAVQVERDSQIRFARLMRELDLDGEPIPDPRPPRGR